MHDCDLGGCGEPLAVELILLEQVFEPSLFSHQFLTIHPMVYAQPVHQGMMKNSQMMSQRVALAPGLSSSSGEVSLCVIIHQLHR